MGSPSDRRRSARRPGKHERARVKNRRRGTVVHLSAAGRFVLNAGPKKYREAYRSMRVDNPWSAAHLAVKR